MTQLGGHQARAVRSLQKALERRNLALNCAVNPQTSLKNAVTNHQPSADLTEKG